MYYYDNISQLCTTRKTDIYEFSNFDEFVFYILILIKNSKNSIDLYYRKWNGYRFDLYLIYI